MITSELPVHLIPNLLSLVIYSMFFWYSAGNIRRIIKDHTKEKLVPREILIPMALLTLFSIATCIFFVINQVEWVIHEYDSLVGTEVHYRWLMFDYMNGLAHLAYALSVKVNLCWRIKLCQSCEFPRSTSVNDIIATDATK